MKERGILFSAPMVRALLTGSKTQTRRIAKDIPYGPDADHFGTPIMDWGLSGVYQDETNSSPDRWWLDIQTEVDDNSHREIRCPYGQPGDRLWVRETFGYSWHHAQPDYFYRASDEKGVGRHPDFNGWKPSIHMPRRASRITLEIVSVRVERLKDISEADCWAEGIEEVMNEFDDASQCAAAKRIGCCIEDAKPLYMQLWESINGPGSWDANPWVWVREFKRILDMEGKS